MWVLFYDARSMLQYLIIYAEQLPHNCLYQRQCRHQWRLSPTGPYSRPDTPPHRRAVHWSFYAGHFRAYEGPRGARMDLRRIWWRFWQRQFQSFEPEGLGNEGRERVIRTCTFGRPGWASNIATGYSGEIVRRSYFDGETFVNRLVTSLNMRIDIGSSSTPSYTDGHRSTLSICCGNCYHLRHVTWSFFEQTHLLRTAYRNAFEPISDFADRWITMGRFHTCILDICWSL